MSNDPLKVLEDALELKGCQPKPGPGTIKALCPAHDDRDPSLSVSEGADGRALIHCFSGCNPSDVVNALGLTWPDMFPDGHRNAGRRSYDPKLPVQNENPVEAFLAALGVVGIGWHRTSDPRMFVANKCPACDEHRPGPLWIFHARIRDRGRYVDQARLACFNGCTFGTILSALEHELTAFERGVAA